VASCIWWVPEQGNGNMWLLIWFVFIPDQGIKYYHLDTFTSETMCKVGMSQAVVLAYDKKEVLECIYIKPTKDKL